MKAPTKKALVWKVMFVSRFYRPCWFGHFKDAYKFAARWGPFDSEDGKFYKSERTKVTIEGATLSQESAAQCIREWIKTNKYSQLQLDQLKAVSERFDLPGTLTHEEAVAYLREDDTLVREMIRTKLTERTET